MGIVNITGNIKKGDLVRKYNKYYLIGDKFESSNLYYFATSFYLNKETNLIESKNVIMYIQTINSSITNERWDLSEYDSANRMAIIEPIIRING